MWRKGEESTEEEVGDGEGNKRCRGEKVEVSRVRQATRILSVSL